MDGIVLQLSPINRSQETQEFGLKPHKTESTILDTLNLSTAAVFCDFEYSVKLTGLNEEQQRRFRLLLNGSELEYSYNPASGAVSFGYNASDNRLFRECYGFVQFQVIIKDSRGDIEVFETEFIQVMVKKSSKNEAIRRMIDYVYDNNSDLLYGNTTSSTDKADLSESNERTLESSLYLLQNISVVFEENYRYFKANSRFITVSEDRVDRFEKLQFISDRTIRFISQHPEELHRVPGQTGIKIENEVYQPGRTLISSNIKSYDIYENRIIVSFLKFIISSIQKLETEIDGIIARVPQKPYEAYEYVTSVFYIYSNTVSRLQDILADLKKIRNRYYNLYTSYAAILPVKETAMRGVPKLTAVFRSVPQYREIYISIVSWYEKGILTVNSENYMLSFLRISSLYEVYVLANLIKYYKNGGYEIESSLRLEYRFNYKTLYANTDCKNYFKFKNGNGKVEVYYQPVIYSGENTEITGIGLFRNTSVSFSNGEDDGNKRGKYYSPDYVIKYRENDSASCRYIIADAKYSNIETVKNKEVPKLAYKYLFSISCFDPRDRIVELCVFNGLSDSSRDGITNIYDLNRTGNNLMPAAEIVTLTENAENSTDLHRSILNESVGRFRSLATIGQDQLRETENLPVNEYNGPEQESGISEIYIAKEQRATVREDSNETDKDKGENKINPPKSKKEKKQDKKEKILDRAIEEIGFNKETQNILKEIGITIIKELVPNQSKKDLEMVNELNRTMRRHIEGVLKQMGLKLK